MLKLKAVSLCVVLFVSAASLAQEPQPCGNNTQGGPSAPPCPEPRNCDDPPCDNSSGEGGPSGGANFFHSFSGNVHRPVADLTVLAVGEIPLTWTRYANSRAPTGNQQWFGTAGNWRHSFQWEIPWNGAGDAFNVFYPDGTMNRFVRSTSNPTLWLTTAAQTDRILQDGNVYTLQRRNGWRYRFEKLTAGGTSYMQLQDITDSKGNVYHLDYDTQKRLIRIMEPAGRYIQVVWQNLQINKVEFTLLATVNFVPPANQWSQINLNLPASYQFRYLRYIGPNNSHGNISEIELYAEPDGPMLTGTPFGVSPSTEPGREYDKAFDGDVNTFYDAEQGTGAFTGLDMGLGNPKRLAKIRLYPRPGFETRVSTGSGSPAYSAQFQGSNEVPQTISAIAGVVASDGRSVSYQYEPIEDPTLPYRYQALVGAAYGDETQAVYSYYQVFATTRPLLASALDPRYADAAVSMRYEYFDSVYAALGTIKREKNGVDGEVMATLGTDAGNVSKPKVTYPGGRVVVFQQNLSQLSTKTDGLGRKTEFTYSDNGYGFLTARKDPLGRVTQFSQSIFGNPLSVTHPGGAVVSWTRDDLDLPLTRTDELGRTTTYTRDAQHRVTRIDHPDESFEEFTYNAFGQVLTHRLRNGGVQTNVYDMEGQKTSATDPLGNVTTFTYTVHGPTEPAPGGLVKTVTDARGNTTSYEYNERGLVTEIAHPDGSSVAYIYDEFGNRTMTINELGKVWTSTYDEFKRLASTTDPLNRTTTYSYELPGGGCGCAHSGGKPTAIILPSGKVTTIAYDTEWQKISETVGAGTPEAATTSYAYDAAGNLVSVTDPLGKPWTTTYDSRNRRLTSTDPLNHTTSWTYDAVGNVLTETRPDNGVTTNAYDAMNRLTSTTDPKNQTTTFAYDDADNLITLTDARTNSYGFEFDLLNRKTKMIYPDASFEQWTFNDTALAGQVATVYRTRAGQTMSSTLDVRDREVLGDWSDSTPDVTRAYDDAGRVLTLDNGVSLLSYSYDDANQLLGETQDAAALMPSAPRTVSYTYDADGNRASLTYPGGTLVEYTYTERNQLASVTTDGPPPIATYSYNLAGSRVSKTLENGTVTSYTYDNAHRLTQVAHALNGTTFASFDYTVNNVGNRTAKAICGPALPNLTESYSYDSVDQVTGVQYGSARTVSYTYDPVGNRTQMVDGPVTTPYTANNLNQYTVVDGLPVFTYDANGNLTGYNGWTFGYDSENRLLSTGNGTDTMVATYDGLRRCVSRTVNGTTLYFVWDGWNLLEERDSLGNLVQGYVHGAVIDETIGKTDSNSTVFYHHDGLGSTIALTNASGAVVESYSYDVFGAPQAYDLSGLPIPVSGFANRFLFTGREWVKEVSLYDYRSRAHSAELGRFLQADPIGFKGGDINIYRYAANNPAIARDPLGLKVCFDESAFQYCVKGVEETKQACYESGRKQFEELKAAIERTYQWCRTGCERDNPTIAEKLICYVGCAVLAGEQTTVAGAWLTGWYTGCNLEYLTGVAGCAAGATYTVADDCPCDR